MSKPYTHGHCQARNSNNGVCPNHNLQCGWPECDRKEIVFQKPEVNELCGCGRPADYTANDGSLCCNKYGIKCKPSTEQTSPLFGTVVNEEGKIRGINVKPSSTAKTVPELAKIQHAAERHGLRQRREAVLNENECRAVLEYINRMTAQATSIAAVGSDIVALATRFFAAAIESSGDQVDAVVQDILRWRDETRPVQAPASECRACDGTGDIHDTSGEWRGRCQNCQIVEAASAYRWEELQYNGEWKLCHGKKVPEYENQQHWVRNVEPLFTVNSAANEGDIDEAIRTGWRCAVVMARNVCVKRSNDWNDEDGSMDRINEANDCSKAIGQWSEPDEEYMVQMRAILAAAQETKS